MDDAGILTRCATDLGSPENQVRNEAAQKIWDEYSGRLAAMVRRHLSRRVVVREDEDDVLQSMFKSFCDGQRRAERALENRDELWRRLVLITMRKVANAANRHTAARRDVRREVSCSGELQLDDSFSSWAVDVMRSSSPGPEEAAVLEEEVGVLLASLTSEQRKVAILRMEGHTNAEIAAMIGRSLPSVELKFKLIRARLDARCGSPGIGTS